MVDPLSSWLRGFMAGMLVVVVIIIIAAVAAGCSADVDSGPAVVENRLDYFDYEVVYVKGMPCAVFAYRWGEVPSATCNWAMWEE